MSATRNGHVWRKASFVVSPGAWPESTRALLFQKMPTATSAYPLLGAPKLPGNEPNPSEGSKSLRGRPSEAEGNLHVPRHTRPDPCRR